MDRLRRRALGRQAEILGPAYLASDIAHLTVGIDQIAAREADALDEATHGMIAALVAGINRQIELFGRDLPPEFQQTRLRARAVHRARCGGDRPRHLVVAERPHRPHRRGRGGAPAAGGVPRAVSDAGSLGASRAAARAPAPTMRPAATTGRCMAVAPPAASRCCAAIRISRSGCRRAGTNTRCTGPRMMPPARAIPAFPACGGAATAASPGRSPTTWPRRAIMYVEQVDPRDPRRYRDGDTWREFDERRVEHQGARRGGARADHPLHGARAGGQRAGARRSMPPAIRRCRCAGSAWSTWTTSAPPSP